MPRKTTPVVLSIALPALLCMQPASANLWNTLFGNHASPAVPEATDAASPAVSVPHELVSPAPGAIPQPETAPTPVSQPELDKQLWDAARAADLPTVNQLLQQGANPNVATALGETALHAAIAAGSMPVVVALVNSGANVNSTTVNGWTPLHHAARFSRADAAGFLLKHGANPASSTHDTPPKTPVQMALDHKDLRMARILGY